VEGVGEAVGVAEAFAEDFVLLVGGECGDKAEGKSGDGCGGADGIEVGVEGAEEDFRVQGGFCQSQVFAVGGAVFVTEDDAECGGGALGVAEAVAEGLEKAAGDEEDGFEVGEGGFEVVAGRVVRGRAAEFQEAVFLSVEDVVEVGELGAEAFGEALTGEGGEIGEGEYAPEAEDFRAGAEDGEGGYVCELGDG